MAASEQLKLFTSSIDDWSKGDFSTFADKFTEDFRRESFPRGMTGANEGSKAEFVAAMQGFRNGIFKDGCQAQVKECVEQPGSLMAFIQQTSVTAWGETFDSDMVVLANFRTGEDGKLRISFMKQFLDGFYLTKFAESMKANGIQLPGA